MGPIRLVIIGLLLYLGYRLVISDWRKKKKNGRKEPESSNDPVSDVLVEDPVCHKLVPMQQAIRLRAAGRKDILYFCSEECCDRYVNQEGEEK